MEYKVGHNLNYTMTRRWAGLYNIHAQTIYSTPPSRSRSVAGDAKTGPELLENRSRQSFCHNIGKLLHRRDMEDPDAPKGHLLTNEVYIELNMLRSTMMDRVGEEVNGGDVVAVDERGLVNITKQLLEQLTEPRAFGNGVGHCAILSLGTRAGDCGLMLGRPRDQRRPKVDTVPRSGAPCVRVASLVRIRVGDEVGRGGGRQYKSHGRSAAYVTEDTLHQGPVRVTRSMHVKTDLLNDILQVGARQSEVPQGTHNGAIEGRFGCERALHS